MPTLPKDLFEAPPRYVECAVAIGLPGTYTYILPADWGEVERGQRLLVPFGGRRLTAFVLAVHDEPPFGFDAAKLKAPIDTLEDETFFDETLLELLNWVAQYYRHPLGEVMAGALPGDANIASRKAVLLTEEGLEAADREPDAVLREALTWIGGNKKGAAVRALLKKFPQFKPATVDAWVRKGWVETLQVDSGKRIPTEKVYRLDPRHFEGALETLSPKGRQVFTYLLSRGEATVQELTKVYGSVASSLKTLEKRGLAVPGTRERKVEGFLHDADLTGTAGGHIDLNIDQALAVDRIGTALDEGIFAPVLLQGVTGSGKTEVYIRLAEKALALGGSVLVLVPEIALTPQLIARFAVRLKTDVAVLHSALGSTARFDMFRKAARGEARVVIGARSAVFAPLRNIKLIVVDEEHESSYKQEEAPRYNARDTALMRGKLSRCPVVLGSATPSMESRYGSDTGRYARYFLPQRATAQKVATVEVVDMREAVLMDSNHFISGVLHDHIAETLERGEQAIIYQNRRGYAPYVICEECGQWVYCADCSVSLVYHQKKDRLHCHYCGYEGHIPSACSHCQGVKWKMLGMGTQRVEESLAVLFPKARIERMDRDTVGHRGAHQEILGRLSRGETDILVGTQMLTKGFDFPSITLVGVVLADAGLSMPDFRAAERSFQTLVQVAGRAGRGSVAGRVIFQTHQPEDPTLRAAVLQDYERFYGEELARRRQHGFPPFMRLQRILVTGPQEVDVMGHAERIFKRLLPLEDEGLRLMGPNAAPIERIKGRYRWHLLLQATGASLLARAAALAETAEVTSKHIVVTVDTDPSSML
jgi:primosomal protein N' (replication factor Y) (superfamily II helicase)